MWKKNKTSHFWQLLIMDAFNHSTLSTPLTASIDSQLLWTRSEF